jgi:GNAT superfamily N-acetyltransferase
MNFTIIPRMPTPAEFNALRLSVEWPVFSHDKVEKALAGTLFAVVVEDTNREARAMGRVLGDGAIYFHIQDVIVHPSCQRFGLGKMVMNSLMKYVDSAAVKNTNIGLMCSKGREGFYKSFGFVERPAEKFGAGMIMIK